MSLDDQPAGLEGAERQFEHAPDLAHDAAAEAGGADAVDLHLRQGVAEGFAAPVGHQHDALAARQKLARQRFRREHVAAGAAGRQDYRVRTG